MEEAERMAEEARKAEELSLQKAIEEAKAIVLERAKHLAQEAGAEEIEVKVFEDIKRAEIESRDMLVEARIMATATGRPPITG